MDTGDLVKLNSGKLGIVIDKPIVKKWVGPVVKIFVDGRIQKLRVRDLQHLSK